jgi:hypothetical protein
MIKFISERTIDNKQVIEFSPAFQQFLIPVNERFPVDYFRDLQKYLREERMNKEMFTVFKSLSISFINGEANKKKDILWAEALLFFCLYCLDEKLDGLIDEPWPDGFSTVTFQDMKAPGRLVCNKLLGLYNTWVNSGVKYPCARPYAFFLLMETVLDAESLINLMAGNHYFPLTEYFSIVKGTPDSIVALDNDLTVFAKKFTENQTILGSAPGFERELALISYSEMIENVNSGIDLSKTILSKEKFVRALVVGLPSSGKTVMIKTIFESANKGYISYDTPLRSLYVIELPEGNEIATYLTPDRPEPTTANSWWLEGEMHINNELYKLVLTDTRGGAIAEPRKDVQGDEVDNLEKLLSQTDILMIVLDPATLLNPTVELFNGIGSRVKYLLQNSKHAMVSILLTKFDEYGVVLTGPRNLINNKRKWDKLKNFQKNTSETTWNEFIEEILLSFNDNLPLRETLDPLLQKLRPIFSIFCITHKHLPVNIYVVNAIDSKDDTTFKRTGLPFIFDEFEAYASCLIEKFSAIPTNPQGPPPNAVENLKLVGEPNNEKPTAIQLTWDVVSGCQYGIRRKSLPKTGFWSHWEDNFAPDLGTNQYTDRLLIKRGHSYQYELTAIDMVDGQRSLPTLSDVFLVPKRIVPWLLIAIVLALITAGVLVWIYG